MRKKLQNFAFIDSQNLNLGIQELGWKLDYKRFRVYLKEKYGVGTAYLFLGYMPENNKMYKALKAYGYQLIFKPVVRSRHKDVKGNVDAELVLQAMIDYDNYEKAIIVTGDGDFYCLVKYLHEQGKLLKVFVPNKRKCSVLLRKAVPRIQLLLFMDGLKTRLEYIIKNPRKITWGLGRGVYSKDGTLCMPYPS